MTAGPVTRETVDNPYSLGHIISAGDWVSRGTLIILTLMSMGSWYILVTKLYESLQMSREAKQVSGTVLQVEERQRGGPEPEGRAARSASSPTPASRRPSITKAS